MFSKLHQIIAGIIVVVFIIVAIGSQIWGYSEHFNVVLSIFLLIASLGLLLRAFLNFSKIKVFNFILMIIGVSAMIYISISEIFPILKFFGNMARGLILPAALAILPAAKEMNPGQAIYYDMVAERGQGQRNDFKGLRIFAVIVFIIIVSVMVFVFLQSG